MLIDVFSDLICPWCYIGFHRLGRALAQRPRLRPVRRWRPFMLNPDLPSFGIDRNLYLTLRFGNRERARQAMGAVEDAARRDGLPLNLRRITRTPNTLDAHRLVLLAQASGVAEALTEALFAAYFVEGLDIGDRAVLLEHALAVGISAELVFATLERDGRDEIALFQTEILNYQLDLHAVPCFIFGGRFVLAGAQEPVAFLPLLDLAASESGLAA